MRNSGLPGYGSRKLANINRRKRGSKLPLYLVVSAAAAGSLGYYFLSDDKAKDSTPVEQTNKQETTNTVAVTQSGTNSSQTIKPPVSQKAPERVVYTPLEEEALTALYDKAKKAYSQNDLVTARNIALDIIDMSEEDSRIWHEAVAILNGSNIRILTTDYNAPGEKVLYSVRPGDNLDRIIKKYHTTIELVQKMNNMPKNSSALRVGQVLKLFKGDWRVKVSKSRYRLYLYNGDKLFKVYNVGTGKNNKTPEGTFEIADKIEKPVWEYQGRKYAYGSAENVLGTRWMKIIPNGTTDRSYRGYGIHGTWEPNSIGTQSSNGCIRMRNKEVEELFSIIPKYRDTEGKRTPVTIAK